MSLSRCVWDMFERRDNKKVKNVNKNERKRGARQTYCSPSRCKKNPLVADLPYYTLSLVHSGEWKRTERTEN